MAGAHSAESWLVTVKAGGTISKGHGVVYSAAETVVQCTGSNTAQGVYVGTNSGWFSDRTVRYLASGRPALVQETGFSRHIRTGAGLLSFRTLDEAIAGAETILRDYPEHCQAARRVAEEFFDSDIVIATLAAAVDLKLP